MRRFVTPRAAVAVAICLVGAGLAGSASAQELGLIYAVVMRRVGFTTDRAELLDEAADASASSTVCGRSGIGGRRGRRRDERMCTETSARPRRMNRAGRGARLGARRPAAAGSCGSPRSHGGCGPPAGVAAPRGPVRGRRRRRRAAGLRPRRARPRRRARPGRRGAGGRGVRVPQGLARQEARRRPPSGRSARALRPSG